jgi:lipopolysaccharide transport system permease protein
VNTTVETIHHEAISPSPTLPAPETELDLPLTVIERRRGWQIVDFRELWRSHELLFFLTWRDVKVRYKQTALGVIWAVLQPLATMIVFAVFLGRMAGKSTDDVPYPLFVFAAMLPWTFFANAISSAANSVVLNQNLVTKVYFPRLIIPMSAVGAGLVDFAISFLMLAALMLYYLFKGYGVLPGWQIVLAPALVVLLTLAALGTGTLLSALTVAYRDVRYAVQFGVQLWMFATPCIYLHPETALSPNARWLLPLNPAYGLIDNFRRAMLGIPLDSYSLSVSAGVGIFLLVLSCLYFRRVERTFADII